MNTTPSSSPELESRAALREQDERQLRLTFKRLADIGVEMVHLVAERAREEALAPAATPAKLPELVISYDRLMRSLRRTALLILKFTAPEPVHTQAAPRPDSARKPAAEDLPDTETAQMAGAEPAERLERLERVEDEEEDEDDAFAGMSDEEIARAYRGSRKAATAQPGVDHTTPGIPAEAGAPARSAAPVALLYARFGADQSEDTARGGAMRRNGATGCRDP
jgi:hypothetical protein